MNCKKRFLGLVLSMTTLVGTLALTTNASDSVKSAVGIVDASALRLREGPGTDTEILTTAYRNDYVVILESEGDWYKVIYNLREGYMHSDYLTVKERENVELGYGEVNTYLVNLRSGHVSVIEKDTGRSVICDVSDFPYTLIWSAAKKPLHFICIEPWHSLPGEENGPLEWEQRPCAASLKRGESWSTTLSTTFVR